MKITGNGTAKSNWEIIGDANKNLRITESHNNDEDEDDVIIID